MYVWLYSAQSHYSSCTGLTSPVYSRFKKLRDMNKQAMLDLCNLNSETELSYNKYMLVLDSTNKVVDVSTELSGTMNGHISWYTDSITYVD